MIRKARWVVLISFLLASLLPTSAGAAERVVRAGSDIRWKGGPVSGAAPLPEACAAATCHERTVRVAAPSWSKPGGLQIGIRWDDEHHDLNLYVYGPDGSLVGSSEAFVSSAESVLLRSAKSGIYRVVVTPVGAENLRYEGVAQIQFDPPRRPARELLPDLVPLRARETRIQTSAYLFDLPVPSMPTGCYPEEMTEQGARRCLRFTQVIANIGAGNFELRYRFDEVGSTQRLTQRIYRSDGTYRDRKADTYEFHPAHAHFHYTGFAQAHLWRSDADGKRLGSEPVRSGRKNGFCMIDVENTGFGRRDDGARTYQPPACVTPTTVDPSAGEASMVNGITAGWADIYWWYLADQFIEISDIPDGYYLIQTVSDPNRTIVESNDTNNASWTLIRLCGDNAEVVGKTKTCAQLH